MVFANPPDVRAQPRAAEPSSSPILPNRPALAFGLRACLFRGLRISDISQQPRIVFENIASHSGIQNAFALAANLFGQRSRNVANHNVIVPISVREPHDPVFSHT